MNLENLDLGFIWDLRFWIWDFRATHGGQSISLSYGRCFAEFLNEGSLVHLRLLAQSTCVGFSTDLALLTLEGFPGTLLYFVPPANRGSTSILGYILRIYLQDTLNTNTEIQ